MATRTSWALLLATVAQGCVADPLEATGRRAARGTEVTVMLVPLDEGASPREGAAAFDDQIPATEDPRDLAAGRGIMVFAYDGSFGIALVPSDLTDEVAAADNARDPGAEDVEREPRPDPDPYEDGEGLANCAASCEQWCSTTLGECEGLDPWTCDCSNDDPSDEPSSDLPEAAEEPSCTWDCDEWCSSDLAFCDADGASMCDCTFGEADEPPEAECTWSCDEWCTLWVDYCGGDGFEACGDTCAESQARPLPASASASAGEWEGALVLDGARLVIGRTDEEVRAAVGRATPMSNEVGGPYGRYAEDAYRYIAGLFFSERTRPCSEVLAAYPEELTQEAERPLYLGICSEADRLVVRPRSVTIRAGRFGSTTLMISNIGSGRRTLLDRDAAVTWTENGEERRIVVPESNAVNAVLGTTSARSFDMTFAVPRDSTSTRVAVTVIR